MEENLRLAGRMAMIYAKLLGELEWLRKPPKRLTRLAPDREAYRAGVPDRERRRAEIEEALPHVAFVIVMLDPTREVTTIKPIRPRQPNSGLPPGGVAGAAMRVLRDATVPMSIAKIVTVIGKRYDLDLSNVPQRQKYHTAVNNALFPRFKDDLIEYPGYPKRWMLRSED
jgi:hypothetical protein